MTFIVSLAHFCEVHGPSMIMCTQAVEKPEELENFYSPQLSESQFCQSCMLKIPYAEEFAENLHFISTQFPTYTERYSSLRQTIVRVFTAETNADLSKPIMFGNSKHGYSIALSFSLLDKTARGSERKYSIIVTSNWEEDLINNYTFILTNLNQVVGNILRSARMVQKQLNLSADDLHNNGTYLRRSAGLPKAKSMVEILKDENFFLKIHMWAAFMLDTLIKQKEPNDT
ncbi:hypothetical protein PICMEDRAFT_48472 [Pichia membranifaciens NRRL Y-2026]|uniref:UDENN FLCN/SMCR8-type domain-containing protein n=1 Tax=Pichia membranifaciens NRRL Y-2026 TaxID=763406 RepID=A0A1E3NSI4_9ASCO|nr:hypothetical protein PICMEDRAFT_48472 [Pichia membranifaciens NRRL Y-2026]ODQ49032.1 hypothetical protein PICMEDRAFT_48472 [Pichia membranifaciens NRRL Y-2026]